MMRKLIPLTALVLGLSGGVALADHGRGGDHRSAPQQQQQQQQPQQRHTAVEHHSAPVAVRDHRGTTSVNRGYDRGGYDRGYNRGYVNRGSVNRGYNRGYVNNVGYRGGYGGRVVRRPIYVARPYIGHRYFNYYQRPALIVESYGATPGYFWVAGSWAWNGAEWVWQAGHYEPDPNYVDAGYGYDSGY
jgi:hypothetical protein